MKTAGNLKEIIKFHINIKCNISVLPPPPAGPGEHGT